MSHSTPTGPARARLHRLRLALVIALAVLATWAPGVARADGDPASDVLATQTVFVPADAGLTPAQQNQLTGLAAEAARSGFPIRVAVVASGADLGSVTALWAQPESYARFLGQELDLVYRGRVLVVMPAGLGLALAGRPVAGWTPPTAPPGRALGAAALTAVGRLAASAGHPLGPVRAGPATGHGTGTDVLAVVVFVLGAIAVVAAWTASLRARPLGLRRPRQADH